MAERDFFIPGEGMVNVPDAGEREYLLPGAGELNESLGAGGTPPGPAPSGDAGLFFGNG